MIMLMKCENGAQALII